MKRNDVPGSTDRDRDYWRDVGTIESFFDAHRDLISTLPVFNLYNTHWPIHSQAVNSPPAKFVRDSVGPHRQRHRLDRLARIRAVGHASRAQRRRALDACRRRFDDHRFGAVRPCSRRRGSAHPPGDPRQERRARRRRDRRASTATRTSRAVSRSPTPASPSSERASASTDDDGLRERGCRGASVDGMPSPSTRFLVVLDADSTLIRNEVIELIADEAGRGAEVTAATEAAMRGEVDFATSLRSRVRALEGVPSRRSPTSSRGSSRHPGARADRRRARARRTRGGGLRRLPRDPRHDRARARRGHLARESAVARRRARGYVDGEIVDAEGKAARSARVGRRGRCAARRTIAIGDGANDLRMMAAAGLGIAFNAKPAVRARATSSSARSISPRSSRSSPDSRQSR